MPAGIFANQQVAARCQQVQLVVVSGQTTIADLAKTKDLLYVSKNMFHFDTSTGCYFLGFELVAIQRLPCAKQLGNEPRDVLRCLCLFRF
jgi:hypothetical protein